MSLKSLKEDIIKKNIFSSFQPNEVVEKAKKPKGDEHWVTIRGRHVLIDGEGNVLQGGKGMGGDGKDIEKIGEGGGTSNSSYKGNTPHKLLGKTVSIGKDGIKFIVKSVDEDGLLTLETHPDHVNQMKKDGYRLTQKVSSRLLEEFSYVHEDKKELSSPDLEKEYSNIDEFMKDNPHMHTTYVHTASIEKQSDGSYITKDKDGNTLQKIHPEDKELPKIKEVVRLKQAEFKSAPTTPEKKEDLGSIHEYNGKKYKKQANGKWLEVSEHGMTKKEHEQEIKYHQKVEENKGNEVSDRRKAQDEQDKHHKLASKLSDKEYTDDEVGLGEK